MSLPVTYEAVRKIVTDTFELDKFVFGPNTDICSIADQIGDPERVEWVIEDIGRAYTMCWPMLEDERGRHRRAQLFIESPLTVSELAAMVDAGAWPDRWTKPGCYASPWAFP